MATAVQDPLVGRLVDGRYQVRSRIARGGMATVYLATDTRLERPVALKVMHPHLADDATFVERFTREARSAARLSHPGVVAVFDQGAGDGAVYLAMEHVPGRTLRDELTERGALPLRDALDMVEAVLDALDAAHTAGLVHRDVKPENVLVGDDGRLRVADFGLARAASSTTGTSASTLIGTVGYLAPELVLHGTADARADVYAVGVVLFELLTGQAPFTGGLPAQIAFRHVQEDVPAPSTLRPDLPSDVDDLVLWSTARDPSRRPADAGQLLAEVREVRAGLTPADLDRAPVTAPAPASDGRTAVVSREHVLALPVGDELEAEVAHLAEVQQGTTGTAVIDTGRARRGATPAAPRPRGRRRWRLAALVAAVVLALAATGAWAVVAGPLARVDVPRVVGATAAEAEAALAARELQARVQEAYSDDVEAGRVVSTAPDAGVSVRPESTVTLTVSLGPQLFAVPSVVGVPRPEAEAALAEASLALGQVAEEFSEEVEAGLVIAQGAAPDQLLRAGTPVDLTVSRGREPIPVPALAGQPRAHAEEAVRAAGLALGEVTSETSETVPEGTVIRSAPGGGTLFRGDAVALVVSSGPPLVDVPVVVGQQLEAAQQQLAAAGLQVQVERVLGGFFGTVRAQEPAGGQVRRGSTVTLTIV